MLCGYVLHAGGLSQETWRWRLGRVNFYWIMVWILYLDSFRIYNMIVVGMLGGLDLFKRYLWKLLGFS